MNSIKRQITKKISRISLNAVVFTSFNGHYSDSPKAISEALHSLDPNIPIIWLVSADQMKAVPSYVSVFDINSTVAEKVRNRAKVLVDNVFCDSSTNLIGTDFVNRALFLIKTFLKTKKTQKRYTTWHGTPLKKMGCDQIGSSIVGFSCPNTTMILGNSFTKEVMERITFGNIPIKLLGCPRNDNLFHDSPDIMELRKTELGLPTNKKVLLFAPTFRSDGEINNENVYRSGISQLEMMEIPKLLDAFRDKYSGEWVLVCRFHYHVDSKIDWEDLHTRFNGKIVNGNTYPDMSYYLACADALITDASSCMFDYMLKRKPCFLFFPDLEYYSTVERGTYFDVGELPFPSSKSFEDLLDAVANFDAITYKTNCDAFLHRIGNCDDGQASIRVGEMIIRDIKG